MASRSRGKKKRIRSSSAPPSLRSPSKKENVRKTWSNTAMLEAIEKVKKGWSVKRAAVEHGVPRTTLQDRIKGRVTHGKKPGPVSYLTEEEEQELCDFLITVGEIGYGKTRKQVKDIAEKVAREKGTLKGSSVSDGWFRRFLERNPQLSLRRGDPTSASRMTAINQKEQIEKYFYILKDVLDKEGLMDKPAQIYNVDETGMPLDHRPPHVVVRKGQKKFDIGPLVTKVKSQL